MLLGKLNLKDRLEPRAVSTAALSLLPFLAILAVLAWVFPPTAANRAQADPLLSPFVGAAPWVTLAVGLVIVGAWLVRWRPTRRHLRSGLRWWGLGIGVAGIAIAIVYGVWGGHLPEAVPPEESAKPGIVLGLSAGVLEELVFRLVVLPAVYFGLVRRRLLGDGVASVVAVLVTSLLFAAAHEIGSAPFDPTLFVTRTVVPGIVMSAGFRWVAPSLVMAAHSSAHLLMPFLFS